MQAAHNAPQPPDGRQLTARSGVWVRLFGLYNTWYLRRHFDALRVLPMADGRLYPSERERTVFYSNHPGWWDPLVLLWLGTAFYPRLKLYGPIADKQLKRYGFFKKLGLFGVRNGVAGAADFLRVAPALLRQDMASLWLTAQGHFADPRQRPVALQAGLAHLAGHVPDIRYVAVALEYPFLRERQASIHAAFCEVDAQKVAASTDKAALLKLLERTLETTQERLAQATIKASHDPAKLTHFGLIWLGSGGSRHGNE